MAAACLMFLFALGARPASARPWASAPYEGILGRAERMTFDPGQRAAGYAMLDSLIASGRTRGDSALVMAASLRRATVLALASNRYDSAQAVVRLWLPRVTASRDTLLWCRALLTLGYSDLARQRYVQARPTYARMLALTQKAGLSNVEGYAWIGVSYLALQDGRAPDAERGYRRALEKLGTNDGFAVRTSRAGLANSLLQQSKPDAARREYERLITESSAAGDLANAADAMNDLGVIEFQYGDPARAAPLFRRSAELQRQLGRTTYAMVTVTNVARCYDATGDVTRAAAVYDSIATAARAARIPGVEADVLGEWGGLLCRIDRCGEARPIVLRALAMRDSIPVKTYADLVVNLAAIDMRTGHPQQARRLLRSNLDSLGNHLRAFERLRMLTELGRAHLACGEPGAALALLREATPLRGGSTGQVGASAIEGEGLLADAFVRLGRRDSALAHFGLAAAAWERSRAEPSDLAWREAFDSAAPRLYAEYAALLLDPAAGGTAVARAGRAFDMLQRFRARTLEDAMRGPLGVAAPPRVTLAELQRSVLRPGELFLDLFSSPDTTFLFAVTRGAVRVVPLEPESRLRPRLRRLTDLAKSDATGPAALDAATRALGGDLLGPIEDMVRTSRVVLLSGGRLGQYGIGLVATPGEDQPLVLARRFALIPSATLLATARRSAGPAATPARGLLAMSRATDEKGVRLQGVARESRWLARTFPAAEVRENDGTRTLDTMVSGIGTRDVLHIASHTRASRAAPWRAGFLLGRGDGEDAWLTARTISELRGTGRICVLAGCASAGAAAGAETMPSLSSAWLVAGAHAVIASLWPVEDKVTAELVEGFYRALARGAPSGDALAGAQSALRAKGALPRDWAGFVLIGDPGATAALGGTR